MDLTINKTVYHPQFGKGIVTGINDQIIIVNFDNLGEKKLLKDWAPLSEEPADYSRLCDSIEFKSTESDYNNNGTRFSDYINQGCSNRHLAARNNPDKLTAGEMAKLLTKKIGKKVSASQIEEYATEWHHAGVFYSTYKKRISGKKVYFFNKSEIEKLIEKLK